MKMRILKYFLSFNSLLVFLNLLNAQEKNCYLRVRGIAEETQSPSRDVTVQLMEGSYIVNDYITDTDGKFEFKLDTGKNYVIVISKPGFLTKKLSFITNVPKEECTVWTNDFAVTIIKNCEGVDLSILENPIDEVRYYGRTKGFKTDNEYTRKILKQLDNLYFNLDNCHYNKYNELIKKADQLHKQGNLNEAKELYREATEMMPSEDYARKQMYASINEIQEENKKNELFNSLKNEGDQYFAQSNYDEALRIYEKAYNIKKDDPDLNVKMNQSRQKIHEKLIAKNNEKLAADKQSQQKEQEFKNLCLLADEQLKNKEYAESKTNFQKALLLKPNEQDIKDKIARIDQLIAKQEQDQLLAVQKQKDDQYRNLMGQAAGLEKQNNLEPALQKYQEALTVKQGDPIAQQKVNELTIVLNRQKNQQLALQEKENQYKDFINQGNNLLALGELITAKQKYQEALVVKPGDAYANTKITEISQRIEQENQRKKTEQEKLLAEQQKQKKYEELVTQGNSLMSLGELIPSRQKYEEALLVKPGDTYSSSKIKEIDQKIQQNELARKQQEEQQRVAKENQYKQLIENGNILVQKEELISAKTEYQKALTIKPDDPVASGKIQEVDRLISQKQQQDLLAKQQEQQFIDLIKNADNFFKAKNYSSALPVYQQAIAIKPNDQYTSSKITEINNILGEEQKKQQQKEEYEKTLKIANSYFSKNDYDNAKAQYEKALALDPGSSFAKQQIEKIEKAQNLSKQNTQAAGSKSSLAELKFRNDNERNEYLAKLVKKYPDGITLEVYTEQYKTINRYVVIREGKANEFREIKYSYGGVEFFINDKATNDLYFRQQTRQKEGEYFKKFDM